MALVNDTSATEAELQALEAQSESDFKEYMIAFMKASKACTLTVRYTDGQEVRYTGVLSGFEQNRISMRTEGGSFVTISTEDIRIIILEPKEEKE